MKLLNMLIIMLIINSALLGQSNEEWNNQDPYDEDLTEQSNQTSKIDPNYDWSWKTIPTGPPPPPPVPIDGGASILLLVGAGYGLRELRKVRNKS